MSRTPHDRNTDPRVGVAVGGGLVNSFKTRCPKDHPYDDVNTYVYTDALGRIRRGCRICILDRVKRHQAAKRQRHADQ